MSDIAIKVENLGKEYTLGRREKYKTLRDSLTRFGSRTAPAEKLWALKDVSFAINRGDVVGVIGRNGAGKSTLLKILSRITEPTAGYADIHGRVGSLLEVGTGFHPELTGRENIFLNGAILGMRKHEITRQFDEIVAFAEVEKFIDTPVKHYSSGMQMRLAFSVAAHLEPEILLVDEVLAVGDAAFQKKCLGKMGDVAKQGRTILFVSHNMGVVKSLCERVMLIEAGCLVLDDAPDKVVNHYVSNAAAPELSGIISETPSRSGTHEAVFQRVVLQDLLAQRVSQVYFGQPFRVVVTVEVRQPVADYIFGVFISALDGTRVAAALSNQEGRASGRLSLGVHQLVVELQPTLLPRMYTLDLIMAHTDGRDIDYVSDVCRFEGLRTAANGGDHYPWNALHGYMRLPGKWSLGDEK